MCLALPLHRPSTSISISISIYNSLSLYLSPYLSLSPLPLPLPLPLPPTFFSYSVHECESNPHRRQSDTATAARVATDDCGQSRHCDHMKEWRRIATAIYSVRPTWLNSGASGARPHIPSTKQAATATAANCQTEALRLANFRSRSWPRFL